jgi:hypothetical protein
MMPRREQDQFFSQRRCDRCKGDLQTRIMSWFTDETICGNCSSKEDEIKKKLRAKGDDPAKYEGCGYIPQVE